MNITLTPEQAQLVQTKLQSGPYKTVEELIVQALLRLGDRDVASSVEDPAWIASTRKKIDVAIESLGKNGGSDGNRLIKELLLKFRKALTPPQQTTLVDAIATFRRTIEAERIEINPDEIWGDVRDRTPVPEELRW